MTDFLLELRSEEIPARMQDGARDNLARLFTAELAKAGLAAGDLTTYATPRRLVLIAHGLPAETSAVSEEIKGPKASAPPQALEGFLRKTGLTRDQLVERDGILFAITEKPGRATAHVLAEAIPAIIRAFPWPKSMRWGASSQTTESLRWVRPLHGIVALFGEDVVPVEIAGVVSSATTLGHRFHHPGPITIGSAHDYLAKLRMVHVIVDQDERRAAIRDGARSDAAQAGLELVEDEGLVAENAGLTEWPVPLLGQFDPAFLDVPPEVIQLTARVNQKYFVCRDPAGKLANAFICTANILATDGGARIVEGNRKVLAARLSDARFFYEQDLKVPLEQQAGKLANIVFHEKLGTIADKVDRVAKLARWLVEEGIVTPTVTAAKAGAHVSFDQGLAPVEKAMDPRRRGDDRFGNEREVADLASLATRAARLAKADLVTGMVGEFPELQGLMGGYYAAAQGEDPAVAAAIRDPYKPVGQGDEVPTAPLTVAVSLADKLDTLAAFFAIGELPTGSKDPFALRRAALGVILLVQRSGLRISLTHAFEVAVGEVAQAFGYRLAMQFGGDLLAAFQKAAGETSMTRQVAQSLLRDERLHAHQNNPAVAAFLQTSEAAPAKLLDFFADRLKVQQREAGVRHDLIDAVFAVKRPNGSGEDDLLRLLARTYALQSFITTDDGANLLAGYKRAANILKKEGFDGQGGNSLSYTPEPAEAALHAALDAAEPAAAHAVAQEDFAGAMTALASLRAPIDAFFDTVIVNDPDADKRLARLALLARVRVAVHTVADFSRIEG
jgi:glycyl-tRNA synthetase beta chain